jgi:arylsulfatase A-like enzyme
MRDLVVTQKRARKVRRMQLRTLMSVDDMIGGLFHELRRAGEVEDTLALFLSDNGFLWGEHGLIKKMLPYTRSIRIPLLMRWPGEVEAGAIDHRFATNLDIAPTVLEAAGLPADRGMDGRSLLGHWNRDRLLIEFFEAQGRPSWASTVTRSYQYTEYYEDTDAVVFREYYDMERDPWQLDNLLAGDEANRVDIPRLSDRLARDRECRAAACP